MRLLYRLSAMLLVVLFLAGQAFATMPPAAGETGEALTAAGIAEPEETDPVDTDPVETDPVGTDPVDTDPVETDPDETDPIETDPVETTEPTPEPHDETHQHYINGYDNGTFMPSKVLSRAEMAQIFYNLGDYEDGESVFPDVPDDAWYAKAINALAAAGLVEGSDGGNYNPLDPVTRAQFVTVLSRMAGITAAEHDATFPDVPKDFWGCPYVAIAQEQGWVEGFPDGTFKPNQPLSRAEAVTMLNRFLGRIPDEAYIDQCENLRFFPDVQPSDWFYYHVMEASMTHEAHMEVDPASEQWLSAEPSEDKIANGYYCIGGKLYVAVNNQLVHQLQDGVCNGIPYHCTGSSGVCTVSSETLKLVNGRIVLIKNGTALYAPGDYPEGFYVANNTIYAAKNGNLLNTAATYTVKGYTVICSGANGPCRVEAEVLILVSGEIIFLNNTYYLDGPGSYDNGFHIRGGAIYVVENGYVVHTAKTGTVSGVSYTCEGASGKCNVANGVLTVADGKHYLISSNKPITTPGLHDLSFGLYYVNSNGTVMLNGSYYGLTFGSNGKYTSGNSQIDSYIENIVSGATNSSMTQVQKLRACYNYVRNHVHYRSNNNHVARGADGSTWTETYMVRLINQGGYGNCYCFASEMYYLARRLGYWQATAISGGVDTPSYVNGDHGWMEMTLNGTAYIFDPQLESTRGLASGTLYMITYSYAESIGYKHYRP